MRQTSTRSSYQVKWLFQALSKAGSVKHELRTKKGRVECRQKQISNCKMNGEESQLWNKIYHEFPKYILMNNEYRILHSNLYKQKLKWKRAYILFRNGWIRRLFSQMTLEIQSGFYCVVCLHPWMLQNRIGGIFNNM